LATFFSQDMEIFKNTIPKKPFVGFAKLFIGQVAKIRQKKHLLLFK
jgi:hypothetical protein